MKRKYLTLLVVPTIVSTLPLISIISCSQTSDDEETLFYKQLLALENVTSVRVIKNVPNLKGKYIVTFKQRLNWFEQDKEPIYFEQRAEIGLRSLSAMNTFNIRGYVIVDAGFTKDSAHEMVQHYQTNYINVEYRYFGQSAPSQSSPTSIYRNPAYWKYLDTKHASKDFHVIIESLKKILHAKWIITGGSKGGQATNAMAMYYPQDADLFYASVGPLAFNDEKIDEASESNLASHYIFGTDATAIGEDVPSAFKDANLVKKKQAIADVQWYVLKQVEDTTFVNRAWNNYVKSGALFNDKYFNDQTKQYLIYEQVFDWAYGAWQIPNWEGSSTQPGVLTLGSWVKEGNQPTEAQKEIIFNKVIGESFSGMISNNFPYKVQGLKEMGLYSYNFSDLQNFIKTYSTDPNINLDIIKTKFIWKSGDEQYFRTKFYFYSELSQGLQFDSELKNNLKDYLTNNSSPLHNNAHLVEMFGGVDPWRAYYRQLEGEGTLANNISYFICWNQSHQGAQINNLPPDQKNTAWQKIDQLLGI